MRPDTPGAGVMPIFATPFAAVPVTMPANATLATWLSAQATEERRERESARDPLCYRSREDLFEWQDPSIAILRRQLLAALSAVAQATDPSTPAEFGRLRVEARARLVIIRPNGHLPAATLPLASWCAVYCAAAPPANPDRPLSGVLRLYEPRLGSMFMDASNWQMRPPFANGHHVWQPAAGAMAAFPAWVTHEVAVNRGDTDQVLIVARARFVNPDQQVALPW